MNKTKINQQKQTQKFKKKGDPFLINKNLSRMKKVKIKAKQLGQKLKNQKNARAAPSDSQLTDDQQCETLKCPFC